jgi:hypothetical protein
MNNPLLIFLATIVLAWLNPSADATPSQQRRQTESAGAGLALEVTNYRGRPPIYRQVIGHDSKSTSEIVITAAMFEDNSFEGDAKTAALFRAYMIGRKLQVSRLLPLMRAAADPTESDVLAAANRLNTQVSSLSIDAETSFVDKLLVDFPTLSADERERLKKAIEATLSIVKNDALRELQVFVKPRSQSFDAQLFQAWLRVNKEKYEKWLSRL